VVSEGLTQLQQLATEKKSDEFFAVMFRLMQEQIGERLKELREQLSALPKPDKESPSNGYHSGIEPAPDVGKWVQVDLGQVMPINEVRLVPARPTDFPDTPGFGFPKRFRVETANTDSFSDRNVLADRTHSDFPNPGDNPEAALTLAIIRQESAFQPDAYSSAGALGLMQLMPATAKSVATRIGLPYSKPRLTTDPTYNISLGRAYLDQLIADYGGSYVLAIAGYNAGPRRVAEWINQNRDPRAGSVDVVDWVESIPISETRNYVQRVLENVQVYRHRIGGTQIALSIEQDLKR